MRQDYTVHLSLSSLRYADAEHTLKLGVEWHRLPDTSTPKLLVYVDADLSWSAPLRERVGAGERKLVLQRIEAYLSEQGTNYEIVQLPADG